MIPHLIHIGYPKAGSTFLQEWFAQHPEIRYQPGAIGGFDNLYDLCRFSADSVWLPRCFVSSSESLSAPLSNTGSTGGAMRSSFPPSMRPGQQKVCDILHALSPQSQILIVTRGFQGLFLSGYSQLVRTGTTLHPHQLRAQHQDGSMQDYYNFDALIEMYSAAFGGASVLVLPFELLRDDANAFLEVLEERLGLSHIEPNIKRLNPSLSPAELYWYPLLSRRVDAMGKRLNKRAARLLHGWHINCVFHNRWHRVIKVLERKWPERTITIADFPQEEAQRFRGFADSLRSNPLYAPYARDYLWNQD